MQLHVEHNVDLSERPADVERADRLRKPLPHHCLYHLPLRPPSTDEVAAQVKEQC